MRTWPPMCAHPANLEKTRRRGRRSRGYRWLTSGWDAMSASLTPPSYPPTLSMGLEGGDGSRAPRRHRPQSMRPRLVRQMLVLVGTISSRRQRPTIGAGCLSSRTPQPAGSSTGARSWPWSGLEIRWRQCRGCAWYTYHSDARPNLLKLSESLAGTTKLFLYLAPGRNTRSATCSKLKLWNDSLQMHGLRKCLRSPGPSPL